MALSGEPTEPTNFQPKIVVKWGAKQETLNLDSWNESIHKRVAAHFGIPIKRLKLLVRGKQYSIDENQALIDIHLSTHSPIMIVGTASELQIDSTQNIVRDSKNAFFSFIMTLPSLLWWFLSTLFHIISTFFGSMFVKQIHNEQPAHPVPEPQYQDGF